MSRKTNISKKPVVRDYGIQSYRAGDEKDYSEIIGTPTFFAANCATVVRESEYAKPYKLGEDGYGDDYPSMEYVAPNWPWADYPGFDYPGMDLPVTDFGWATGENFFPCSCSGGGCYDPGETKCFYLSCNYPIGGIQFVGGDGKLSIGSGGTGRICITASSDATSSYEVNITLAITNSDGKTIGICVVKKSFSKCLGTSVCDDSGIAWDSSTSAETIARSDSASVAITDSVGYGFPYAWSVSGTGFTLDNAQTDGLTNTLNADASACGTATITVTGCDGTVVTGEVRCTTGKWVTHTACANFPACGAYCGNSGCGGTVGNKLKYQVSYCVQNNINNCIYCVLSPQDCPDYGGCATGAGADCSVRASVLCEWVCGDDPRANCSF